ncbi:MAG: LysR family transcriptional regulator [Oscillospiraceae bacterium]|nr:LysR family transcriptional regulator [Oscillospiraceae bacterium]
MRDFDWQILVTLHKTHNISKTAELLYVSQPTLTKRIQVIEDELGIPLIVRSRKGSVFTAEGERIAQKAESIVAAIQEIKEDVAERNKGAKGVLRLGVPYSYVRYVLPALMAEYVKTRPNVEFDVITGLSDELTRRVEDDTLDLTFARYNAFDTYLERIKVSEDQVFAVYNRPFTVEELPELPFIEFSKNPMILSLIQRWWNENFSVPRSLRFKVPTGDCCIAMVKHGLGYGIFPDPKYFMFEKGLYSQPMTFADGTSVTRLTWLLYEKSSLKNPLVRDFVDFIKSIDVNRLVMESETKKGENL